MPQDPHSYRSPMEYFLKAPAVGDVGRTVTIVKYHKAVGERVEKDEPIMTLETNKAALEIESMVSGTIKRYIFAEGDEVQIGKDIAVLQIDDDVFLSVRKYPPTSKRDNSQYTKVEEGADLKPWLRNTRNGTLSPREKSYCLNNKVVPISAHKDFCKFLDEHISPSSSTPNDYYTDIAIDKAQLRLVQTLVESNKQVVQANVQAMCDNTPIENYRRVLRRKADNGQIPTRLELIVWSVIGAMKKHAAFRSRIVNATTIRQFKNPNIGIALALENDGLTTAVLPNVFTYDFVAFLDCFRRSILEARREEHVVTYHSLVISDLSAFGITNAVPVVSYPAAATLFIGKPYLKDESCHWFNFSLSFDHRHINGAGAARFMQDICRKVSHV